MELRDIQQILQPIRNRIFAMVAKAIIKSTDDGNDTQTAKVEVFKEGLLDLVERYSQYGFESRPKAEAEAIVLFRCGQYDQGIVILTHDRRYRPKLEEGEAQVFDWNGSVVHLKKDKSILIESAAGANIDLKADGSIYAKNKDGSIIDMKSGGDVNVEAVANISIKDGNGNEIKTNATQVDINGNLTVDI